ncbi:hypothetical protein F0562_032208 [Nyssa sinensis]|uniref:Uncharacterized protein n=1 Tax=Nyssa sinensis TaxID=561372 RepID=A0A5J5B0C1_9ASTE|nr:hypothetical protein F0562_032208 [Nyssa sinensis]
MQEAESRERACAYFHCLWVYGLFVVLGTSFVERMNMWNYGPNVMEALVELIISLAASSGKYVDSRLLILVNNFMPPRSFLELLKQPHGVPRKDQVLYHVHSALKGIADLVHLAPLKLQDIITQRMPHIFKEEGCEVEDFETAERLSESLASTEKEKECMAIELRDAKADCDAVDSKMQEVLEFQIAAEEECASLLENFAKDVANNADLS